jgi:peptide/nickel transport system ATP-binding protein
MPERDAPLLDMRGITVRFGMGRRAGFGPRETTVACDDVALDVRAGETVGLVGESGSGKSTLCRVAVLLQRPDGGEVVFRGTDLTALRPSALRAERKNLQMIFQDPRSSLNPRWRVRRSLLRPLRVHGTGPWADEEEALHRLLDDVDLDHRLAERYPHELSGGQAQRVCIARALALRPSLVIADEALSGLDVTTQESILDLMVALREQYGTAFLFVSHDLRVVKRISSRAAVMNRGRIVEFRPTDELFADPRDAYTRTLLTDVVHTERTPYRPGGTSRKDG